MEKHQITFILILTVLFHAILIFVYTSGFLLTKTSVNKVSKCDDNIIDPEFRDSNHNITCWNKPLFKKAVILLIDALRFDFTEKLTIFNETISNRPENAFLFKFYADPPTTTMQRLLAMTTGGMPTFIDASSNFDSSSVIEDNWIQQMKAYNKKVIIMGDDTWMKMYPDKFEKSYPYPSFNVKDLHTVDNGVIKHLIPEMTSKEPWDVIIGHFLGVDHAGHRFGAYHPEMDMKLAQMDRVIKETMEYVDEDTILFIMGDHGMVDDGYHAGASDSETNTALFVYTPRKIFKNMKLPENHPLNPNEKFMLINQIDFVPTLSLLLGIPIPYENLGAVIPELYMGIDRRILLNMLNSDYDIEKFVTKEDILNAIYMMNINSKQVLRYIEDYTQKSSQFNPEDLLKLKTALSMAKEHHLKLFKENRSINEYIEVFDMYKNYLEMVIDTCRRLWTSYDDISMILGIIVSLITICIYFLYSLMKEDRLWNVIKESLGIKILIDFICGLINVIFLNWPIRIQGILIVFASSTALSIVITLIRHINSITYDKKDDRSLEIFKFIFYVSLISLRAISLLSTSYILEESYVMNFLMMTQLSVIIMIRIIKENASFYECLDILKIMGLLKLLSYSNCGKHEIYFTESNMIMVFIQTYLSFGILGWKIYNKLRNQRSQSFIILNNIQMVFVLVYWISLMINILDHVWIIRILFPCIVYILCLLQLFILLFTKKMKYEEKIWKIFITLIPTSLLILGPGSPYTVLILMTIIDLYIHDSHKNQSNNNNPSTLSITNESIGYAFFIYLFMGYMFYSTGHRPDFNSIQFAAPFVGFDELNYYPAFIIVLFNTLYPIFVLPLMIPLITLKENMIKKVREKKMMIIINSIISYSFLSCILSMVSAYLQRRHLFIWTIFAPKYIFESASLLLLDLMIVISVVIYYSSIHEDEKSIKEN